MPVLIHSCLKKRGPQSQLERQLTAIAALPRKEQQQLLAVVEAFISQHAQREGQRATAGGADR